MSMFKTALLAGAAGLMLSVSGAQAQDYGYSQVAYEPESVIVQAPRYRVERYGLNAPSKISLSQLVPYDDLDLRTRDGAQELRFRVGEAAREICTQLVVSTQIPQLPGTHCYRDAYQAGLVRAQAAIRDARSYGRY